MFRQFAWHLAEKLALRLPPAPSGRRRREAVMEPLPIDGEGRFAGYASVFGRLDDGGDIVMPGAFRKSLGAARTASDQNAVPA